KDAPFPSHPQNSVIALFYVLWPATLTALHRCSQTGICAAKRRANSGARTGLRASSSSRSTKSPTSPETEKAVMGSPHQQEQEQLTKRSTIQEKIRMSLYEPLRLYLFD